MEGAAGGADDELAGPLIRAARAQLTRKPSQSGVRAAIMQEITGAPAARNAAVRTLIRAMMPRAVTCAARGVSTWAGLAMAFCSSLTTSAGRFPVRVRVPLAWTSDLVSGDRSIPLWG